MYEYFISAIIVLAIMGSYIGIDLGKNNPRFYKNCEMKMKLQKQDDVM